MEIERLATKTKSELLAALLGWRIVPSQWNFLWPPNGSPRAIILEPPNPGLRRRIYDLYDPQNMAAAWAVLNWAWDQELLEEVVPWWMGITVFNLPPADAQRTWLDKVLELAVQQGLIVIEEGSTPG